MTKDVFDLEKGDFLSIYNRDYVVEEIYKIGAGEAAALNCLLRDGREERWFAARRAAGTLFYFGEKMDLEHFDPESPLEFEDGIYHMVASKQGRAVAVSNMGYPRYVNMEYYDYRESGGEKFIFIQRREGESLIFEGEPVISSALVVFPSPKP